MFIISSCGLLGLVKNSDTESGYNDPDEFKMYIDSVTQDGAGLAEPDDYSYQLVGAPTIMKNAPAKIESPKKSKGKTTEIIDKVAVPDITKGLIAYNVPDGMTLGKNYSVKIRITRQSDGKQELVDGNGQPIAKVDENSTITIESIRVESVMSADLISPDGAFLITTGSTKEQNIETHGFTEWEWNIRPTKSGDHFLKLLVKVRITSDQGGFYKDIVVFERSIKTEANLKYSVGQWLGSYWQWLCTTFLIPLFLWWRKRKKPETT